MQTFKLAILVAASLAATIATSQACEKHNADAASQTIATDKTVISETRSKVLFSQTAAKQNDANATTTLIAQQPWAKPNYGPNGAAYFTLKNNGGKTRYLTGASAKLSEKVELHQHLHADGIMKMRPVSEPLPIKPGDTLIFAPGGYHVMMFGMSEKKKPGETFTVTLEFQDGEKLPVDIEVADNAPGTQ